MTAYTKRHPQSAQQLKSAMEGKLPKAWDKGIPGFQKIETLATRVASGQVLNALAERVPTLMGGSADLAPSNKTIINASHDFMYLSNSSRFR